MVLGLNSIHNVLVKKCSHNELETRGWRTHILIVCAGNALNIYVYRPG